MRPLFVSALALALGFPTASGCGSPRPVTGAREIIPTSSMSTTVLGEPFTVARGASVLVEGRRLHFDAVREDSRCGEGLTCVWEGKATAVFSFVGARSVGNMAIEIPGYANAETAPRPTQSLVREGFRFTLLALDPYPGSADAGPDAVPVATLRIEPIGP